jgi:hypothetical protein
VKITENYPKIEGLWIVFKSPISIKLASMGLAMENISQIKLTLQGIWLKNFGHDTKNQYP